MITNSECKYFYQHYGYNKKHKFIHTIFAGHCLYKGKTKNKNCKNCPFFEQKENENEEIEIFNILQNLQSVEYHLKKIETSLSKLKFIEDSVPLTEKDNK